MSTCAVRRVLTTLMYACAALFCVPYLMGREDGLFPLQVGGVLGAVVFGLARCYWTDEDCWQRVSHR